MFLVIDPMTRFYIFTEKNPRDDGFLGQRGLIRWVYNAPLPDNDDTVWLPASNSHTSHHWPSETSRFRKNASARSTLLPATTDARSCSSVTICPPSCG